ncbi:MAG: hypothetical protein H9993_05755, partial [Candidatus Desulfovibrio faecigallinarum]|nr:hypothetical protein [Candidatus Desulfovibrio faecigallinarum]
MTAQSTKRPRARETKEKVSATLAGDTEQPLADASHVSVTPDVLLPEQPVRERTRRRVVREAVVKGGQGESEPEDQDIDVASDGDEMDVDILGPEEDEEDSGLQELDLGDEGEARFLTQRQDADSTLPAPAASRLPQVRD